MAKTPTYLKLIHVRSRQSHANIMGLICLSGLLLWLARAVPIGENASFIWIEQQQWGVALL